jgi:hypothetical protein
VAEELNRFFTAHGLSPIQRKPVIGRTGPDYTTNELGLIIDEKSRRSVPKSYNPQGITRYGNLIGVKVCNLGLLLSEAGPSFSSPPSKIVTEWYEHMDAWTRDNFPGGIAAIVIRKPGSRMRNACFLIRETDREVLRDRFNLDPSK